MRIGIDIDGVLANFYSAYEDLTIKVDGRDLFGEHKYPNELPCTWNWPEYYGYSKETMREVWKRIKESDSFWANLQPLATFEELSQVGTLALNADHDVYFITARPGVRAKRQTEDWLEFHIGPSPTVLLSDQKGYACRALDIELYIDDKGENIVNVEAHWPHAKAILINRPYNTDFNVICRADSLKDALKWVR